jgi:hypothetical protein
MPRLTGTPLIRRAWRYRSEPDRIHFIANGGSADRHLYVDRGTPLYAVLEEALLELGYAGPSYPGRGAVPEYAEPVGA